MQFFLFKHSCNLKSEKGISVFIKIISLGIIFLTLPDILRFGIFHVMVWIVGVHITMLYMSMKIS